MAPSAKWFGLTAAVLVLLAFLSKLVGGAVFDLQIHDTYFVISPAPVSLAMAFFLAVCSAAYYFIPMNPRAIGLHFWVTSVGLTVLDLVLPLGISGRAVSVSDCNTELWPCVHRVGSDCTGFPGSFCDEPFTCDIPAPSSGALAVVIHQGAARTFSCSRSH